MGEPIRKPFLWGGKSWARGGQLHREGGPAFIVRDRATGAVVREGWWLNGKRQELPRHAPETPRP
jgi:hypothetical protein